MRTDAPIVKAIGQGAIGLKSKGLIEASPGFEKAGLPFPIMYPLTSGYFSDFYGRAAVSRKTSEIDARIRIGKTPITKSEMDGILDASLGHLTYNYSLNDAVLYSAIARSDEWPAGTGIFHSEEALSLNDIALFKMRLETAIKGVLASGFSEDAKIFCKLKGLGDEANGALLMPYYGYRLFSEAAKEAAVFPLFLSIVYAGPDAKKTPISSFIPDRTLFQWRLYSTKPAFDKIVEGDLDYNKDMPMLYEKIKGISGITTHGSLIGFSSFAEEGIPKDYVRFQYEYALKDITVNLKLINKALPVLFEIYGPFYAEFEVNSAMPLQFAKINAHASNIDVMAVNPNLVFSDALEAIGTCKRETEGVRFASDIPTEDDLRFNESHSGYLLHIKSSKNKQPMSGWGLRHLCNAAAIYLQMPVESGIGMDYGFHLGGYLRELGIPLLVSRRSFNPKEDGKYLVQADEFRLYDIIGMIYER